MSSTAGSYSIFDSSRLSWRTRFVIGGICHTNHSQPLIGHNPAIPGVEGCEIMLDLLKRSSLVFQMRFCLIVTPIRIMRPQLTHFEEHFTSPGHKWSLQAISSYARSEPQPGESASSRLMNLDPVPMCKSLSISGSARFTGMLLSIRNFLLGDDGIPWN